MYNFDPYNVLLAIATNIPVLLMTAFVLQGHIFDLKKRKKETQFCEVNKKHLKSGAKCKKSEKIKRTSEGLMHIIKGFSVLHL